MLLAIVSSVNDKTEHIVDLHVGVDKLGGLPRMVLVNCCFSALVHAC